MLASSIPAKLPIPFASSAGGSYIRPIPTASQIGIQNGAASLTDGFVPDNFLPTASGGVPPFGQDMNGILNWATEILQWAQAGGPWPWDSAFSSAIGGYPGGAVVTSIICPGKLWRSLVDNNTTNPDDATSVGWATPPGMFPSGTPVPSFSSAVPVGFVAANGLTVGNASSNATALAAGAALFLFAAIWNEFPNSQCQLLNSGGSPVSRGANPFVDFAANRQITLPNAKGCSLVGVDTMGGAASTFLAGVPIISGNTTTPGSQLGENLHSLTSGENGAHNHGITDPLHLHTYTSTSFPGSSGPSLVNAAGATAVNNTTNTSSAGTGITINNSGSGTGHNTVSRSFGVYWNLAL